MEHISEIKTWLGSGSINIFGLPFSGKDTQCDELARLLGASVIGGGEILRSQSDNEKIQTIMASGALMPSDIYFDMVVPYLSQERYAGQPLVLSSVGRMQGEETVIVNATETSGHPTRAVILLNIPEADVWQRFDTAAQLDDRGDRPDDGNRTVLENRINKFNTQTQPVIDFYRAKGLLIEIDGTKSREEVTARIVTSLYELATAS